MGANILFLFKSNNGFLKIKSNSFFH